MAGTRATRGGTGPAAGGRQAPNPTQGKRTREKGAYDRPDTGLSMRNTAMPGQGRGRTGHEYDRLPSYANPGRKAGGATQSGYVNVGTSKASSAWDGNNDLAFPSYTAHYKSQAGRENRSKDMSQTSGTPTSVLNTGANKFKPLKYGDSPRINTGRLDSGNGTGWDGPEQ